MKTNNHQNSQNITRSEFDALWSEHCKAASILHGAPLSPTVTEQEEDANWYFFKSHPKQRFIDAIARVEKAIARDMI